jgi:prepilin-type N-terminal cleavage/methylation domain-containing protein
VTDEHEEKAEAANPVLRRDRGMSFIEVLVAVVLLGTAVVGTLAAVRATVIGTRLERDHAKAHQWLQSASENVRGTVRWGCDTYTETQIREHYQNEVVRLPANNPTDWPDERIEIVRPVKVWDGEQYLDPYTAPQNCYDNQGKFLQLVTIQVLSPDGDIIESVEVVKRD